MNGGLGRGGLALLLGGYAAVVMVGFGAQLGQGARFIGKLQAGADTALMASGARGVSAGFTNGRGWLTRHPTLSGGDVLADPLRARAAAAVAAVPGMGGVHWAARGQQRSRTEAASPVHDCQAHVEAILRTRTIRFAESSAALDPVSYGPLDEVAAALRPCAGSIIAITGHTDGKGDEVTNLALSMARAQAVRNALAARGIDMAGLRAKGVGSVRPLPGLEPGDPANRRIEFSVIAPVSLEPTPVDTPGAG